MLQHAPIFVGDLKPVGTARPLAVVRPDDSPSSLVTISISCLSTLTLLAAAAAWLVPDRVWTSTSSPGRPASVPSAQPSPPSTFPPWVEVPHLTGPLAQASDPDAFSVADGPRTLLGPNPARTVEQLALLPPRANPHLPLISRAPLDATRLTREQAPAWNEYPNRQDIVTAVLPSVVATLQSDSLPPSQDPVETRTARTLPADPVPTILPPRSAPARAPTEIVVRSPPTISTAPALGHVATLGPDPSQSVVVRTNSITPPRDVGAVVAPILTPGPVRHARSLRRLRAATAASQARVPYREAEQTASIISEPTTARGRIDASAIAHASMHRTRGNRPASSPASAPSSPWTLPSALAPTD